MAGFVDALRSTPFTGVHFKRWQARVTLWLTAIGVFLVSNGKPEGQLTVDHEKAYEEANTLYPCGDWSTYRSSVRCVSLINR
jgi:hypothetical protein